MFKIEKYSIGKGISNTAVNTIPAFVFIIANFLNKKFNMGLDETEINAFITVLAMIFYWLKNYIKNRKR